MRAESEAVVGGTRPYASVNAWARFSRQQKAEEEELERILQLSLTEK